jgi:hypothetical protein
LAISPASETKQKHNIDKDGDKKNRRSHVTYLSEYNYYNSPLTLPSTMLGLQYSH